MINELNLILDFLYTCWDQFILLYFSGGILTCVFAIYILRKVSKLIEKLR